MAVKIRLKRLGKIRVPQYRIVVVDARKKRDGKVIEEIGKYHPKEDPSYIDVASDRAQYWLGVGAQPTEAVQVIFKITGDWQTFKGLPGADGRLKVKPAKRDKLEIFNEALKEVGGEPTAGATTKKASKKAETKPADETKPAPEPASEAEPAKPEPAAEATPADEATPVPAVETPAGATEEAETAETAEVDAEQAEDKGAPAGTSGGA